MASSCSRPATVRAASSSAAAAAAGGGGAPPHRRFTVSFPLSPPLKNPLLSLLPSKGLGIRRRRSTTAKAQLNEVVGGSSGGDSSKPAEEVPTPDENDSEPRERNSPPSPLPDEAISAFMSQVASLVKLVDSRDIIELQLKQLDCELIIRKKEALPQPPLPPPAPFVMMQPPSAPASMPSPVAASVPSPARASSAPPAAPASAPKAGKPSHPPLKSPMAGTFYRSPGPGQPPFVKPGDKVKKGQALCIIEAMKLMNEIEADHAGTLVEILVEDGKPVGIDQPLFVIEP